MDPTLDLRIRISEVGQAGILRHTTKFENHQDERYKEDALKT